MDDCTTRAGGSAWCARAGALLGVDGMHVLAVHRAAGRLELTVETTAAAVGCPGCGVAAVGHGRRPVMAADAPCFGAAVELVWGKRVWRARGTRLRGDHVHRAASPRRGTGPAHGAGGRLGGRRALTCDDATVSALARHLGVDWHTLWDAVEAEAGRRLADPGGLVGVRVLGVDEHVWHRSGYGSGGR